ncbi:MAG: 16S rRNA (guanine(527)-N(7))-methyltransferase RsmG [Sphingobacteriia bacterium]|nr:16S rRNA (guanine(527)-N(7))-methyltransferase RsmG [Sphingobacteriia bacterium]
MINRETLQNQLQLNKFKIVSRETILKIQEFIEILFFYNKTINLVSKTISEEILLSHIFNSIELAEILKEDHVESGKVSDLGSGNGFPGVILAICNFIPSLIELDERKAIFLEEVKRNLKLDLNIINADIQNPKIEIKENITIKALASVCKCLTLIEKKISEKNTIYMLKGKKINEEINEALKNFKFQYNIINKNYTQVLKIYNVSKIF